MSTDSDQRASRTSDLRSAGVVQYGRFRTDMLGYTSHASALGAVRGPVRWLPVPGAGAALGGRSGVAGGSVGGPGPNGLLPGLAHRGRLSGCGSAAAHLDGGVVRHPHGQSGPSAAGPPLGAGDGGSLRCRRGVRDDPELRDGPAVARVDGHVRAGHRAAVRPGGYRLLHRGDLLGDLPVRLGPDAAQTASAYGRTDRHRRCRLGILRGVRQRVDEPAARLHPAGRQGERCRPVGGDVQSGQPAGDRSHDPCRSHGGIVPDRFRVCRRPAARPE
jgi:hypothetical protein